VGWLLERKDTPHRQGWPVAMVGETEGVGSAGDGRGGEVVLLADGGRVSASLISGWRAGCACGWRGPLWRRARRPDTVNGRGRWLHSDSADPDDAATTGIHREWLDHAQHADAAAQALTAITAATTAHTRARAELDTAVACARATGASWDRIAHAAGITRQAAHRRWAHHTDPPSP